MQSNEFRDLFVKMEARWLADLMFKARTEWGLPERLIKEIVSENYNGQERFNQTRQLLLEKLDEKMR